MRCRRLRAVDRSLTVERTDEPSVEAERLNAAIDRLLAERRPEPARTPAEAELLQTVVLLWQARSGLATLRPAFSAMLSRCLQQCQQGGLHRAVSRRDGPSAMAMLVRAWV